MTSFRSFGNPSLRFVHTVKVGGKVVGLADVRFFVRAGKTAVVIQELESRLPFNKLKLRIADDIISEFPADAWFAVSAKGEWTDVVDHINANPLRFSDGDEVYQVPRTTADLFR